jgi:hypothetical protein
MSGENVLPEKSQAQINLEKVDKALVEYEKGCGIPDTKFHNEAEQYLSMTHNQLQKLTAEQCGEAAIVLAQFGFHLQRNYNTEMARVTWADESCKSTVAPALNQYKAPSFEERKLLAIRDNDYATKIDAIRRWAKVRAERLAYLSGKVEFLARALLDLQQTKRRQNNNGF